MAEVITRLYYNKSYQAYDYNPCFFIYIVGGGMYISTLSGSYKVLETPREEITDNNVDTYAESRGFIKVLEKYGDNSLKFFNDFDNKEGYKKIYEQTNLFCRSIFAVMRYRFPTSKPLSTYYSIINGIKAKTKRMYEKEESME